MTETYQWTLTAEDQPDVNALIKQMVRAYRMQIAPEGFFTAGGDPIDHQPLNVYLRSSDNELIAGLLSSIYFGCCHISWLWVHEAHRNQGLARQMFAQVLRAAQERGCNHAWGTVWERLGAHTLYEKLGASLMWRHDLGEGRALLYYRLDF